MSYLTNLVDSAKNTDGYTGRQGGKYARMEQDMDSDNETTRDDNNDRNWIAYAGIGAFALVGGIYLYRNFFRTDSGNGGGTNFNQSNKSSTSPVDPELRDLRKRNEEIRKEKDRAKRTDWERFRDKVPDNMVSDKDSIFGGKS